MTASVIIIVVSGAAFFYWFRYTCYLIRNAAPGHDHSAEVAREHDLWVADMPDLFYLPPTSLPAIARWLNHDYRRLRFLLRRARWFGIGSQGPERYFLELDFLLLNLRYRMIKGISPAAARSSLIEMHLVISRLANCYADLGTLA